jgi:DNA-directed RNA polymerase
MKRYELELSEHNPLRYLKEHDVNKYIDKVIGTLYLYTRPKKGNKKYNFFFSEVICAIGHVVRRQLKLKTDTSLAAKTGAFILYSFQEAGVVELDLAPGSNGHAVYIVRVVNDDVLSDLWQKLPAATIEKLPSETPYEPWVTAYHSTGMPIVKTGSKDVLALIRPETHKVLFEVLNRAQRVGWRVNKEIFDLYLWALKNKTDAFAEIWEMQNPEAKATKLREAKAIGLIAKKFLRKSFYHLYYYDFRGRKYPATAYLHEQGSDLARGLLLRDMPKKLTERGYWWLMVGLASNWANVSDRADKEKTDKIPLEERFQWAVAHEEELLSYAENPKEKQGWMSADKPWQFLALCIELRRLREYQYFIGSFDNYDYMTGVEIFLDGSNNGCQHLAALTRDETTAPHVNLVPTKAPGDLYRYIGEHVWQNINAQVAQLSEEEIAECQTYIDNLVQLKKNIVSQEPKSDERAEAVSCIKDFKGQNIELGQICAPVFWTRIKDLKHIRKIVKRNIMTLPYGGTAYGLSQQQIDDARKHGIELLQYLEHSWAAFLGRQVYNDCRVALKRPMQLLSVFEKAGKRKDEEGGFLSWVVPITNFPVIQHYTEGIVKKLWIQYGPPKGQRLATKYYENTLQINVSFIEDTIPAKGKQSQGASPNIIHSLDAAHLALTVYNCSFPVTTIHDSYGASPCDMDALFKIVRESFVQLYSADPLSSILEDIHADISDIDFGTLDINLILQSEYAFS